MFKTIPLIIKLFLLLLVLKAVVWSFLIPLWQTPDEQAHFGHVAYLAEGGLPPLGDGGKPDMNEEIYTSLEILGTKRDEFGNNKFTYHPEYRLDYGQSLDGPREKEISELPQSARKNFVIQESAYYPHFFYYVSAWVYQLFYNGNLFVRVFAVRLAWMAAYLLTVLLAFKTTRLIFPRPSLLPLAVAVLVGFHPMLNFVASGVTSDNLYNLLFSAVIYLCLKIITAARWQDYFYLALTLALGIVNKQQFLIAFLIVIPAWLIAVLKNPKKNFRFLLTLLLIIPLLYLIEPDYLNFFADIIKGLESPYIYFTRPGRQFLLPDYTLFDHLLWTIKHTIREVIPWYWGVFRWLSLVLPRWVNQVLNRLVIFAAVGLLVKVVRDLYHRKFDQQNLLLIFVVYIATVYFFALLVWDWTFFRAHNFSFGIQGRYYFPVIISHMVLLAVGVKELLGRFGLLILSLWFICLNFIALYTLISSYYDISNFNVFILQASQYKPFFAKGWWLITILSAYLGLSLLFIWQLIKKFLTFHEK